MKWHHRLIAKGVDWHRRLTLKKKIMAAFLLVACISGLSGILAAGSIWEVSRRGELMYTGNVLPLSDLTEVVKGYQTSLYLLRDIVIDLSPQERQDHLEQLRQAQGKVAQGLASFFATNRSPEAAALKQRIEEDLKLFDYFRDKVVDLASSDRRDEAVNIMRTQASDVMGRIDAAISEVVALNKAQAQQRHTGNSAAARYALIVSTLCLSIGVAAALLMGYLLSARITASLATIAARVAAVAAGDLTARIGTVSAKDELDVVSLHVDRMADTLHSVVARITSESGKLQKASGTLNRVSETMAKRTEHASCEVYTVAASGQEMAQTASEIARNCITAADNVGQASGTAEQGRRIMQETIGSMRAIGQQARESSLVVARLGERSLQIGAITETIDDIADQTNLLALNAAIEAARAGEHGRGFAIVADEVRALARRTTSATKEISAMVRSIQGETKLARAAMEKGVAETELGVQRAEAAGEALDSITATIASIASEVSQIATAAEEQSSTVHGISANIETVTSIIRESAAGTQEFATASSGLHLMAQELERMVGGFSISISQHPTGHEETAALHAPGRTPLRPRARG